MVRVKVLCKVTISERERRVLCRTVDLPTAPRVGDFLCAESWGLTFEDEGAKVETIGIGLDDGVVWAWIRDDDESWRDMAEWGDPETMLSKCYIGFE